MAIIVGQTMRVLLWYPTAVVSCACKPNQMSLIVITHFNRPEACPQCGRHYAIRSINEHGVVVEPMTEIALPSV
jgi:hypothetical protein